MGTHQQPIGIFILHFSKQWSVRKKRSVGFFFIHRYIGRYRGRVRVVGRGRGRGRGMELAMGCLGKVRYTCRIGAIKFH